MENTGIEKRLESVCDVIEKEKEAKLEAERTFLQEMDEDEYDALSEEQKRVVDQHQLLIKKQRMQRYTTREKHANYSSS